MSTFTDVLKLITGRVSGTVNAMVHGQMTETYNLNSCLVMNTKKARSMFHNTENGYKLAAGMIKPIINADVSFIGKPVFSSENDRTNEALKMINKKSGDFYHQAHKVALREGDMYIWVQWDDEKQEYVWVGIPDDKLDTIVRDPISNKIVQYVFKWHVNYKDKSLANKQMTIAILIEDESITYRYTGDVPVRYKNATVPNVLKTIPVVQLSNEREDFESKGHSEITAIEPYLKAYHDVMMMALQAQKNNAAPKLKIKSANFKYFIDSNFGAGTFDKMQKGELPEGVNVKSRDLLLMSDKDDADYMSVSSTTGSAEPLLAILFYLIVETSETIEVVFGANLGTSLASVESQLPVYVKKIERKQIQFEKAWLNLVELTLIMNNVATIDTIENDDVKVTWTIVDFQSAKEKAETLKTLGEAYGNMLDKNILSMQEVHEEVRDVVDGQEPDYDEHLEQVTETAMLRNKFNEDAMSQGIDLELEEDNQ